MKNISSCLQHIEVGESRMLLQDYTSSHGGHEEMGLVVCMVILNCIKLGRLQSSDKASHIKAWSVPASCPLQITVLLDFCSDVYNMDPILSSL